MKYILATILYAVGCYLVFGIHGSSLHGTGPLVLVSGNLALMGRKELTKPIRGKDFIPRTSKLLYAAPEIFGLLLIVTILIALGDDALVTLLQSPSVGLALWLFLVALVFHRYLTERTNIQPIDDGNAENDDGNAEKPPGVERTQ